MSPSAYRFTISRIVEAPRETVYRCWTEEDRLKGWFGPKGLTMPFGKLDLRPGGQFHYSLRFPDGTDMWGKWTFREIVPSERLEFISSFSDENGGLGRHPFAPEWPAQMLASVSFVDMSGTTEVTVSWEPYSATEVECAVFTAGSDNMRQGWDGTFDRLAEYLLDQ